LFKHAQLESVKTWLSDPAYSSFPLHARIQRAIRQLILDGALEAGKPLPASRGLALSLGVSRDTVESAYSQLHAEGFIERRVGSGSVRLGAGAAFAKTQCAAVFRLLAASRSVSVSVVRPWFRAVEWVSLWHRVRSRRVCRKRAAFRCKSGSAWSARC
jgi:DNA-binding transcriptional MocR family regulator